MSLHDFLRFPGFRKKAVTLSYDDGMTYDARLIDLCECSVETQLVHDPTDIDVYVDLRSRERVIPVGKTVQL